MTIAVDFNRRVLKIWTDFQNEVQIWADFNEKPSLMPAYYPAQHFHYGMKLLMLGMNPAFNAHRLRRRINNLNKNNNANINAAPEEVYRWHPETGPHYEEHLLTVEKDAFENYLPFFGPQKKFAKQVGCSDSYSHMDLFHIRQTNQADFVENFVNAEQYNVFRNAQVELTRQTIRAIRPKIVVIANAGASRLAMDLLELEYVDNLLTQCTLPGLPKTRIFLAGMISGGRAMDEYSRIRLETQVKSYLATCE